MPRRSFGIKAKYCKLTCLKTGREKSWYHFSHLVVFACARSELENKIVWWVGQQNTDPVSPWLRWPLTDPANHRWAAILITSLSSLFSPVIYCEDQTKSLMPLLLLKLTPLLQLDYYCTQTCTCRLGVMLSEHVNVLWISERMEANTIRTWFITSLGVSRSWRDITLNFQIQTGRCHEKMLWLGRLILERFRIPRNKVIEWKKKSSCRTKQNNSNSN